MLESYLSAMKTILVLLLFVFGSLASSLAQGGSSPDQQITQYPFIIQDSPGGLFTMRQVDQDYLSGFRLFAKVTNENLQPALSYPIQAVTCLLAFKTFTHEEGHRSILVGEGIGSVTHPFFLSKGGGMVTGVTDQTLKNLRDTKFPTYIRLHTAGFESDYTLATREETLLALGEETYKNLFIEYLFRKAALVGYFAMGIFKHDIDGAEEPNELQRDIVGNDLYGVIRHLHRPTMEFRRYTRYENLTGEELHYLKRLETRTFLNLLNANLIGVRNFRLTDKLSANAGMGHCMGPFGDFIDEKFWFTYRGKLKIDAYLREFQNRTNWFPGAGVGIRRYPITRRIEVSLNTHIWKQPLNLGFNEKKGEVGGAVDVSGSYNLLTKPKSQLKSLSLELGMIYKTAGFLPEQIVLDEHWGFRFGIGIGLGAR
jgi:hypothetical protein